MSMYRAGPVMTCIPSSGDIKSSKIDKLELDVMNLTKKVESFEKALEEKHKMKKCSCCQLESFVPMQWKSNRFENLDMLLCLDCIYEHCLKYFAEQSFENDLNPNKSTETNKTTDV